MRNNETDPGEYLSVEQFEDYLQTTFAESTNDEVMYLRTNVVADELGLSHQQVGQLFIRHISESDLRYRTAIEKQSSGTRIEMVSRPE